MTRTDSLPTFPVPDAIRMPAEPSAVEQALADAEAEIDAGLGTPNKDVCAWLRDLANEVDAPPPCDR